MSMIINLPICPKGLITCFMSLMYLIVFSSMVQTKSIIFFELRCTLDKVRKQVRNFLTFMYKLYHDFHMYMHYATTCLTDLP